MSTCATIMELAKRRLTTLPRSVMRNGTKDGKTTYEQGNKGLLASHGKAIAFYMWRHRLFLVLAKPKYRHSLVGCGGLVALRGGSVGHSREGCSKGASLMLDQSKFSVNVRSSNGKEWTQYFPLIEQASLYLRNITDNVGQAVSTLTVMEYNFEMLPDADIDVFAKLEQQVSENARRLESWARRRSLLNYDDPKLYPCEICEKPHSNYHCCEACNYGEHRCHFCGDDLGHRGFSACYIMYNWEENYVTLG